MLNYIYFLNKIKIKKGKDKIGIPKETLNVKILRIAKEGYQIIFSLRTRYI